MAASDVGVPATATPSRTPLRIAARTCAHAMHSVTPRPADDPPGNDGRGAWCEAGRAPGIRCPRVWWRADGGGGVRVTQESVAGGSGERSPDAAEKEYVDTRGSN